MFWEASKCKHIKATWQLPTTTPLTLGSVFRSTLALQLNSSGLCDGAATGECCFINITPSVTSAYVVCHGCVRSSEEVIWSLSVTCIAATKKFQQVSTSVAAQSRCTQQRKGKTHTQRPDIRGLCNPASTLIKAKWDKKNNDGMMKRRSVKRWTIVLPSWIIVSTQINEYILFYSLSITLMAANEAFLCLY